MDKTLIIRSKYSMGVDLQKNLSEKFEKRLVYIAFIELLVYYFIVFRFEVLHDVWKNVV
jgi:hypothetical protein